MRRFSLWRLLLDGEIEACKRLLNNVPEPEQLLDLGTGQGTVQRLFNGECPVVGLDVCQAMLRRARTHAILPVQADTVQLPFHADVFDGVTAMGLSEYIADEGAFFDAVAPVLRSGGWLLYTLSPPSIWTGLRWGLGHRLWARRPRQSIAVAVAHGFECIDRSATLMQAQLLFRLRRR